MDLEKLEFNNLMYQIKVIQLEPDYFDEFITKCEKVSLTSQIAYMFRGITFIKNENLRNTGITGLCFDYKNNLIAQIENNQLIPLDNFNNFNPYDIIKNHEISRPKHE